MGVEQALGCNGNGDTVCRWRRGDEEVAGEGMEEEEEEEAGEGMGEGWGRSGRRAAEGHWESEDALGSAG